jgi:hypothetical protein
MEEEDVVVHDVMMAIGIFTTPIDDSYELIRCTWWSSDEKFAAHTDVPAHIEA